MGKDTSRFGKWKKENVFEFYKLDEDGAGNFFGVNQDKVTRPTLLVDTWISDPTMTRGIINRIHYRLNFANAATFTLRIWRDDPINPYELNLVMLYESPALQADDIDYDRAELTIPMFLVVPGRLYYSIGWTAAPGNTPGFLSVSGVKHQ